MNLQPQYRFSLVLALLLGMGAVVGIFHYQNLSTRYIFPIDKDTLSIT